jgi:PIN domain nuclease of toxin-antitoxin system
MNYLLDTHTLIWFLEGDNQLSEKAKVSIEKNEEINFISIASLWEIAIKISIGKLELKTTFSKIAEQIFNNGFQILPINFEDTLRITELPFHHRDPFDRIIISQCFNNNLFLISKDRIFTEYDINLIW